LVAKDTAANRNPWNVNIHVNLLLIRPSSCLTVSITKFF
jgi:hypothetical protein